MRLTRLTDDGSLISLLFRTGGDKDARSPMAGWWSNPLLFSAMLLFLSHLVFFSVLGMGGMIGTTSNLQIVPGTWEATLHRLPWGAIWLPLDKGQRVRISYNATIQKGGLHVYLSKSWPAGMEFSKPVDIYQSGKGETWLTAPADGWYRVKYFPTHKFTSESSRRLRECPLCNDARESFDISMRWTVAGLPTG